MTLTNVSFDKQYKSSHLEVGRKEHFVQSFVFNEQKSTQNIGKMIQFWEPGRILSHCCVCRFVNRICSKLALSSVQSFKHKWKLRKNCENFIKGLLEKIILNVQPNYLVCINNTPYHKKIEAPKRTKYSPKKIKIVSMQTFDIVQNFTNTSGLKSRNILTQNIISS